MRFIKVDACNFTIEEKVGLDETYDVIFSTGTLRYLPLERWVCFSLQLWRDGELLLGLGDSLL